MSAYFTSEANPAAHLDASLGNPDLNITPSPLTGSGMFSRPTTPVSNDEDFHQTTSLGYGSSDGI